jgi:DNA-binding NtrC family response regulator
MQHVRARCGVYGPRRRPVVVQGETGTGKSLVALALHRLSPRCAKPFVRIAAGELDPQLVRATLAGHVKGGFTGAVDDSSGLLGEADGGTVFLDEVQELLMEVQSYLLDAIEGKPLRAVGEPRPFVPDVRWVFGTQRALAALVAAGKLKRDLAARMGRTSIELLPLRERAEDLEQLVPHLLLKAATLEALLPVPGISPRAMSALLRHPWPDNVRELEDVLSEALIEAAIESASTIEVRHLPEGYRGKPYVAGRRRRAISREELLDALDSNRWIVKAAAAKLGVDRKTVSRWMLEFGIQRPSSPEQRTGRQPRG